MRRIFGWVLSVVALVVVAAPAAYAREHDVDRFFRVEPRTDVEVRVRENFRIGAENKSRETAERFRDKTHDNRVKVGRDTSLGGGVKKDAVYVDVHHRF
jgi:hypothetical protein